MASTDYVQSAPGKVSLLRVNNLDGLNGKPAQLSRNLVSVPWGGLTSLEQAIQHLAQEILGISDTVESYTTLAAAKADKGLEEGQLVVTRGCYGEYDLGGWSFIVVGSVPSDIAVDGYSCVKLANGKYMRALPTGRGVIVQQFGAKGDGSTNDTEAFARAMAFAAKYRECKIVIPRAPAYYLIGELDTTAYQGLVFEGYSSPSYNAYSVNDLKGQSALVVAPGSSSLFKMKGLTYFRFTGICLSGTDKQKHNWAAGDSKFEELRFTDCGFYNFNLGCGSPAYIGTSLFVNCVYCNNVMGISNTVDSSFMGGFSVSNGTGIYWGPGANDCVVGNMKVEFNKTNVSCYQSEHNSLANCVVDRAEDFNYRVVDAELALAGGTTRRAGYSGSSDGSAHAFVDGKSVFSASGVTWRTGNSSDDNSGKDGPEYMIAVGWGKSAKVSIVGGSGPGGTKGALLSGTDKRGSEVKIVGVAGTDDL